MVAGNNGQPIHELGAKADQLFRGLLKFEPTQSDTGSQPPPRLAHASCARLTGRSSRPKSRGAEVAPAADGQRHLQSPRSLAAATNDDSLALASATSERSARRDSHPPPVSRPSLCSPIIRFDLSVEYSARPEPAHS